MARATGVDASEHLGILHKVLNQFDVPGYMKDEALSEGMVLLVHAASTWDSQHGVPPHYWIAAKLRWGLLNWKIGELRRHGRNDSYDVTCLAHDNGHPAHEDIPDPRDLIYQQEVQELLEICKRELPEDVFLALTGNAAGYQMKELSHALHANPKQIKELQAQGRALLNDMKLI